MKKLSILFAALVATTALWASNVITYKATSKLPEVTGTWFSGLHTDAFKVAITDHSFSSGTGTITFAGEVTSIGTRAFYSCTALSSITCYATPPPVCGWACFYNVNKSIPLYVPEGSIDAYKAADEWKYFTNIKAIATDIKNVNVNENANRKVMKDGQVVIVLKDGHSYTLSGTPIE